MAKDYEKKWKQKDPYDKWRARGELADFYGVDPGATGANTRPGANYSGKPVKNHLDIQREINDAMANGAAGDYLRYSGQDLPHADDMGGMWAVHKEMEDDHQQNSGGSFNNASDVFGVANRAHYEYNTNLAEGIVDDVMSQVGMNSSDDDDDTEEEAPSSQQSFNEAIASGNLSFDQAYGAAPTTAQIAAQALLKDTVQGIADDDKGLLNSDKYLIDYSPMQRKKVS